MNFLKIVIGLRSHPEFLAGPKCSASRTAVSAVIARLPNTISLMRRGGPPTTRASRGGWGSRLLMMTDRYGAHGLETKPEPGLRGRVLGNLREIKSAQEMERCESEALIAATQRLIDETEINQRFTVSDICAMHPLWLASNYPWAGCYRRVNIAKGEFLFAAANQVPRLMQLLEQHALEQFTPCRFSFAEEQARALAC